VIWKVHGLEGDERERGGIRNEHNLPKMQEGYEASHQKGTVKVFHEVLGF
tara:strand:+ start:551 stop:700 length:150 start_codon:yes stop_codon:yes gene_type:complete